MAQGDAAKAEKKDAEKNAKEIEKKKKEEKKKEEEMVKIRSAQRLIAQPITDDSFQTPEDLELKEKLGLLVERAKDTDSAVAKAALESMRLVCYETCLT
jgi:hypothetical protein